MQNILISKQIKLQLTPEQWELYNKTGVAGACAFLNLNIAECLNSAKSKDEAWTTCMHFLELMYEYGATDTEPRYVLTRIFNLFFDKTA